MPSPEPANITSHIADELEKSERDETKRRALHAKLSNIPVIIATPPTREGTKEEGSNDTHDSDHSNISFASEKTNSPSKKSDKSSGSTSSSSASNSISNSSSTGSINSSSNQSSSTGNSVSSRHSSSARQNSDSERSRSNELTKSSPPTEPTHSPISSESPYKDPASDTDYQPEKSPSSSSVSSDPEDPEETKYCKENKFIVFESKLDELFHSMHCVQCSTCVADVQKSYQGSMLLVTVVWNSGHTVLEWSSQPCIGKASVGNLLGAAATLFSGNTFTNINHLINRLGVKFFSHTLFYDIQGEHFIPVVNSFYHSKTGDILHSLSGDELQLVRDGRCDSPGCSAKYCSYTMMSMTTHQIVASELVQVSQASSSVAMEKEGFSKCVERIGETNRIDLIATDRHVGIRKLLKDEYPI